MIQERGARLADVSSGTHEIRVTGSAFLRIVEPGLAVIRCCLLLGGSALREGLPHTLEV
jgi:hypothetical protein